MSYDPTQLVPPPIEPTQREDDLIPPPPPPVPIDVRELPNFKVKDPPPRKTIAALSVLAVLVVSAAVYGYVASRPPSSSTPKYSSSDYTNWLNQEQQKWHEQGDPIVYAAFVDQDWQTLYIATVNVVAELNARSLCSQIVNDYTYRFHQSVSVQMTDNQSAYLPFTCDS